MTVIRGPWRKRSTWRTTAIEVAACVLCLLVGAGLFYAAVRYLP